jgi:hypothetical protein
MSHTVTWTVVQRSALSFEKVLVRRRLWIWGSLPDLGSHAT